ncbi:hypothetical protein BV22DRAFT_990380, partial [Leucogyrophana mollusca]
YDIVAIQEPHINFINLTTSNSKWDVIYPATHSVKPADTHSVLFVNKTLSKNNWRALPVNSPDITAIELEGALGTIRLYNVY